jgi:hypothetical protein
MPRGPEIPVTLRLLNGTTIETDFDSLNDLTPKYTHQQKLNSLRRFLEKNPPTKSNIVLIKPPVVGYYEMSNEKNKTHVTPIYREPDVTFNYAKGTMGAGIFWFEVKGVTKTALIKFIYGVDKDTPDEKNLLWIEKEIAEGNLSGKALVRKHLKRLSILEDLKQIILSNLYTISLND